TTALRQALSDLTNPGSLLRCRMYCYLVANVIIFPLRCFYKNGYFFEKHRFFSTFSEKQGDFSEVTPEFYVIFRKTTPFFHQNPQNRKFSFSGKIKVIKNIFQLFYI
ncbi:MAG: hypothetical protein LUC96_03600, partial [Alistipes sp.]|uniref:hypothetical protein n=1 Tax=Alistipes sp. TaxID=1872444 RepID=UPI0025C28C54